MKKTMFRLCGLSACLLFVATTLIGGFLNPGYGHVSQFISELYAVGAPNADALRFYGYLPSGVLFMAFAVLLNAVLPKSTSKTLGCLLFGFGYGFGTVICSIFNCDVGCNPEFVNPSLSQFIHNLMGMLTYLTVPTGILCLGISFSKHRSQWLFNFSIATAVGSFLFVLLLNVMLQSGFKGFLQRIIEGSFILWAVVASVYLPKNLINNSSRSNP